MLVLAYSNAHVTHTNESIRNDISSDWAVPTPGLVANRGLNRHILVTPALRRTPMSVRHGPGVPTKLYTGVGGWDKNAVALKEMKSNEEPLP